jgi:fumarate reductase iron-sulfur subunit
VLRHNPREPGSRPHLADLPALDETPGMTLFIALTRDPREQDPSLQFDFVCRAGICGSCAMLINGRPAWPAAR